MGVTKRNVQVENFHQVLGGKDSRLRSLRKGIGWDGTHPWVGKILRAEAVVGGEGGGFQIVGGKSDQIQRRG